MALEEGREFAALSGEPELMPYLESVFRAFSVLDDGRQIGLGMNPISTEAVLAYCRLTGVRRTVDRRNLLYSVRWIDAEWRKMAEERRETRAAARKKAGKR